MLSLIDDAFRSKNGSPKWARTPDAIALPSGAIRANAKSIRSGQGVVLQLEDAALDSIAAAAGLSVYEFRRRSEFHWTFGEQYVFDLLGADARIQNGSGEAVGQHAAHVYVAPGAHTARCLIHFDGKVYSASETITVAERNWQATIVGYADPGYVAGGYTDPATGATALDAHCYTDIDDALLALDDGDIDVLLVARGKSFTLRGRLDGNGWRTGAPNYRVGANQEIRATGTGSLPIINVAFGVDGVKAFYGYQRAIGDGVTAASALVVGAPSQCAYYENDVRITPSTVPADGARVEVVQVHNTATGELAQTIRTILRLDDDNAVVRDLDIRGDFDAANPGEFDPDDLTTFQHSIMTLGVEVYGFRGGPVQVSNATVYNCSAVGLRGGFNIYGTSVDPTGIVIANCYATDWYDYAALLSNLDSAAYVGCHFFQNVATLNGPGNKAPNQPGLRNYPDHGPIRSFSARILIINRSRLGSYDGWNSARVADYTVNQPCIRAQTSDNPLQDTIISECDLTGGRQMIAASVANLAQALPVYGQVHVLHNWFNQVAGGEEILRCLGPYVARNNLVVRADSDDVESPVLFTSSAETGDFATQVGFRDGIAPILERNTILVRGDRPTNSLTIGRGGTVAQAGVINALFSLDGAGGSVGGFVVPSTGSSVTVPAEVADFWEGSEFFWRVWRSPVGGGMADAVASETVDAQDLVYRIGWDGETPTTTRDVTLPGSAVEGELTVELVSGSFTAGETIYLSRERTEQARGYTVIDGELSTSPSAAGVFPRNGSDHAADVTIPDPEMNDNLIIIEGDWDSVKLRDGDGAVPSLTPYRSATWGAFDAHGLVPQAGNAALAAAGGAVGFDWTGARRTADRTLGALRQGASLAGQAALIEPPTPYTVTWNPASLPLQAGGGVTTADVVVTGGGGVPTLSLGSEDCAFELVRGGVTSVVASVAGLEIGDRVTPRLDYAHPTLGFRRATGGSAGAFDPAFAPAVISNNATGYVISTANAGASGDQIDGKMHFAARMRLRALPSGNDYLLRTVYFASGTGELTIVPGGASYKPFTPTVDQWFSVLITQETGVGVQVAWKDGAGALQEPAQTTNASVGVFPPNSSDPVYIGSSFSTPSIEISHGVGIWEGGTPQWSDFFEADGAVKQWNVDTSQGVAGMEPRLLLWGLAAFQNPQTNSAGSWGALVLKSGGTWS